jgi:ubiquinone/menaquinone biosynthesis C-methylase UbiE
MAIPFIPMRKTTLKSAPLPVVMSGVRMGERVLQIGIDDPAIAGAIAAKAGVSGRAAFAVQDDRSATAARTAAENAMALADVEVAPVSALPFLEAAFDLVVLNARKGALAALDLPEQSQLLREARRVLRPGGRMLVMQTGAAEGLAAWLRPAKPAAATPGMTAGLEQAGFRAVRVLANREGYLFTEGLKA